MKKPSDYTEAGDPIYRYEEKEREWQVPNFGEEGWIEKIEGHFEKFIGPIDSVFHEILSDLIHVDVNYIKPSEEYKFHTLFTTGMSYLPMNTPEGLEEYQYAEVMVCLPPDWPISDEAFRDYNNYWPVRWMKMLARFPHEYETWLGFGHTMPAGDPPESLSDSTKMSGILLVPPIQFHEDFLTLRIDEKRVIHFYAIVPLYEEEMEFKLKHGTEPLLDKFDKYGITEIIEINRKNVCKSPFSFWK